MCQEGRTLKGKPNEKPKKKLGRGTEALRGCNRTKSDKSGFCMALEYFYHFFKASGFRDFLTR